MAQDFGDDMGNALLNFVTRQTENYLRFGRGRERAFDWWQRHYKNEGNTPEAAKAMAEKQSSREQVVVPFGTSEEAAYYAQVCRENGTYAAAYTDKQGNGFLAFAKEDAKTVAGYAPQFKDVMARLDEQRITDALNHAEPVNKKTMDSLTELTSYPDLPAEDVTVIPVTIRYKDAPEETYDVLFSEQDTENLNIDDSICFSGYSHKELTEMVGRETHEDFDVIAVSAPYKVHATQVKTDAPEKTYDAPGKDSPARSYKVSTLRAEDTAIHTQNIRNAAEKAREDCTDFSDFERKMNAQGFGVTETSKGEVMAYEPASLNKDGSVPAYERGRDWPVSAETLKNRYDLDVTHNWFEQNTPKDAGTLPDGDLAMQNARLAQEQMRDEQQLLEPVASDGSMDNDGRTPDPNSGIESHDGADTDSRTAVMDAEQTGSEIRPSDIREEQQYDSESYSLTGEARDMTAAKNQMDTETKAQETTREHGSSLPFNGEDVLYPSNVHVKHPHGLTLEQIKRLPELLERPVVLMDSDRDDTMVAVLADVDGDGLPLIAALKPGANAVSGGRCVPGTIVCSVYGKPESYFLHKMQQMPQRVLYQDIEKGRELDARAKLQLFGGNIASPDLDRKIIRLPECIVKLQAGSAPTEAARVQQESRDMASGSHALGAARPAFGTPAMNRPIDSNLE